MAIPEVPAAEVDVGHAAGEGGLTRSGVQQGVLLWWVPDVGDRVSGLSFANMKTCNHKNESVKTSMHQAHISICQSKLNTPQTLLVSLHARKSGPQCNGHRFCGWNRTFGRYRRNRGCW